MRHNGYILPSPRTLSLHLASSEHVTPDTQFTHMLMQWGQFLDHDLDFVPVSVSNARFTDGRFCNETCDNQSPCFAIPVDIDDPRITHRRCIGFARSSAMCGSGMTSVFFRKVTHRDQLNLITAYIDASNVYGNSDNEARNLRDFTSNLLANQCLLLIQESSLTARWMPARLMCLASKQEITVAMSSWAYCPCTLYGFGSTTAW